ncbi:N-terminal 7TM region of histidine kinase [Acetitomaculum ruminis DSM 5522]|uniref:N-terminal 7TM region of histidine kinase n=1 Tax=Acetitomaculum ruminis DSM 5522 TaxID=1120918 RepID=A0A1I0WWQ6_9FIRM|nr:histidine kinase N-terminal 7TM domain-containing protein [Acetitomaculum ruminis]SFA92847.1 N-terminal 7TM region of histidine kinase [Acetitomaculum ruminis DSM 5522]
MLSHIREFWSKYYRIFFMMIGLIVFKLLNRDTGIASLDIILETLSLIVLLFIFIGWGVSIQKRILQKSIKRYIYFTIVLVLFWLFVRIVKYNFVEAESIKRYLWYLYYVPITMIPLMGFFMSFYVGEGENYNMPKITKALYIPAVILIVCVFTNDLHQKAFYFYDGIEKYEANYSHKTVYVLAMVWVLLMVLLTFIHLYLKCLNPKGIKNILMPTSFILTGCIYSVLYIFFQSFISTYIMDLTLFMCFMTVGMWESCVASGFIITNNYYESIFSNSDISVIVVDDDLNKVYSSQNFKDISKGCLKSAKVSTLLISEYERIKSKKIHGGYVMWMENISELVEILDEIRDIGNQLKEVNEIEASKQKLKKKSLQIEERTRLYDKINDKISNHLTNLKYLLDKISNEKLTLEESKKMLAKICIKSVFIKRLSNFMLITENEKEISVKELEYSIKESFDYMSLYNISTGIISSNDEITDSNKIIRIYEFFEKITYENLEKLLAVRAILNKEDFDLKLIIESLDEFQEIYQDNLIINYFKDGKVTTITIS